MGKKVISFSLYGKNPVYTLGAIANARQVNRAYPGWVCRFYVADDVPEGAILRIKDYGAEVIKMGPRVDHNSMFWRFFAMVDPEVDIALSRDVDSRFTKCELLLVKEWLVSGKKFHVIGHSKYSRPILGGLWGVRGGIPNFKELLEGHLRSGLPITMGSDERFLKDILYPQMKGKVFVHAIDPLAKRKYFLEEPVHPFPPIAKDRRGKFLNKSTIPVGLALSPRRTFMAFSVYKRTIFSEFLLTLWLGTMEKTNLFRGRSINIRFYVADNISLDLIEHLRRYGRVILKPAKTVRKDDPQYWKLLIFSEKNLGVAVIVDFWQIFFLARAKPKESRIKFDELLPIERGLPTGIRSWFTNVPALSICGPAPPVSDIENLVARRDPNENYREFIRSTVYPRTSTTRMISEFSVRGKIGFISGLVRILVPLWLHEFAKYLKKRIS